MKAFSIILFSILISISPLLWAQENVNRDILVVRAHGQWPPYEMEIEGKHSGLHVDLVTAVAERLNISVRFESYPWKRAIDMLKTGKANAITYMAYTEERNEFGIFVKDNIMSSSHIAFFCLKENADKFKYTGNLRDLEGYTIGNVKAFLYDHEFDHADYLSKDETSIHERQLVLKIVHKRLPIAIGNITDVTNAANQLGVLDKISFLQPLLQSSLDNYLVFARINDNGLAKLFANEMAKFKKTEEYKKILNDYSIDYYR
ncbi:transporter substrate-binding domain-containing protein [Vibrio hannami]|uniref:substrate-binding periplasmic protein n=1 Tax=Vibrio hannami TaxID=2717094 RepID=UPI00240F440E|nr:transporter substrate-binding domain-containing protein [Vibrio hannami]MDG3085266.1 transporter substrate-binding domain-containing protein [Vibrio hannami]